MAVIAMVAGASYAQAQAALRASGVDLRGGLHNHEMLKALKSFGVSLSKGQPGDWALGRGFARVRWDGKRGEHNPGGHFVALDRGNVYDPTGGTPCDLFEYLRTNNGRLGHFYMVKR